MTIIRRFAGASAGTLLALLPLLSLPSVQAAEATAVMSLSPSTGTVAVGGQLTVQVKLDTGGQAVSAVRVKIVASDNLDYTSASGDGSVFATEVTPPTETGPAVEFARLRSDSGYNGSNGLIMTLVYTATASGAAVLALDPDVGEAIAYSDSSNILASVQNGSYVLGSVPTVSSLGPANVVSYSETTDTTPGPFTFTLADADSQQVKYDIQIDDDANFSSPIIHYTSALADAGPASFSVGQAAGSGTYIYGSADTVLWVGDFYWRVRAIDSAGTESSFVSANSGNVAFRIVADSTTAPGISNLKAEPGPTSVTVTWTTSLPGSTKMQYGVANTYGFASPEGDTDPRVTSHLVYLADLLPCTIYHYTVQSAEADGTTKSSPDATFVTTGCVGSAPVLAKANAFISKTTGGEVNLTDTYQKVGAFRLTIPADFSANDAVFQVKQLRKAEVEAAAGKPAGYSIVGNHLYFLEAIANGSTKITSFTAPISVRIVYADAEVAGISKDTLAIYRYDESSREWSALTNCVQEEVSQSVTCPTTEFSIFALIGAGSSTLPETGDNVLPLLGLALIGLLGTARLYWQHR
jgi:hypothetical protein